MTVFVLLHGGGLGGWMWRDVAEGLRTIGHHVLTPTLTGFGDRAHLIGRDITHDHHVRDVLNTIHYEDATDIVLVGYSYGGTVVPGVVAGARDRVRRVILLDGMVPRAGESGMEAMGVMTGAEASELDRLLAAGDGPIGTGADRLLLEYERQRPYRMNADRRDWMLSRVSDFPMRSMVSPISVGADMIGVPACYLGVADDDAMIGMHERIAGLGWQLDMVRGYLDHFFPIGHPDLVIEYLLSR